ncbi:hypothetical protein CEXT_398821 [Caerostris extrusa]|uniref:Uncharacterized protein n=1 Tax=Caerostris extrusa TaxID=172846 RepID=A0AAV4PPX3_CAEEX|nr:hypothetical protein CEXT_398821 [Caerostris extrusa]
MLGIMPAADGQWGLRCFSLNKENASLSSNSPKRDIASLCCNIRSEWRMRVLKHQKMPPPPLPFVSSEAAGGRQRLYFLFILYCCNCMQGVIDTLPLWTLVFVKSWQKFKKKKVGKKKIII